MIILAESREHGAKKSEDRKTCQHRNIRTAFERREKSKSIIKSNESKFRQLSWQSWRAAARIPVEVLRDMNNLKEQNHV
jgi:hypothetical protein